MLKFTLHDGSLVRMRCSIVVTMWCLVLFCSLPASTNGQVLRTRDSDNGPIFVRYPKGIRPAFIAHALPSIDKEFSKQIDDSIQRGLTIAQNAAKNYPSHRECFSCHHQTLPLMAMKEAGEAGFEIDKEIFEATKEHTLKSFSSRHEKLNSGRGIGGRANTVSYGLWALDVAAHEADETTTAMVAFLLKNQRDDGSWAPPSNRLPLEESQVSTTVLSAYYMSQFADKDQREEVDTSMLKARKWLADAALESQEDVNFRLWGLVLLDDGESADAKRQIAEVRDKILAAQRDDGGWSQIPNLESDAYATGQTLYVLNAAGLPSESTFLQHGVEFLLKTQHEDGSWLVETRSKPVQVYFDNGDPHGESQFISVAATSWAVAALARIKHEFAASKHRNEGAKP